MKISARSRILAVLLAATLVAVVFAPPAQDDATLSAPVTGKRRAGAPGASAQPVMMDTRGLLANRQYRTDVAPIFPATVRAAPRVAPRRAEPAPVEAAPQAPPVPFRVLGRFVENGVAGMFVQLNERTIVARNGDVINELYKVESISDQTMTVLYLPLNVSQTVNTGGTP